MINTLLLPVENSQIAAHRAVIRQSKILIIDDSESNIQVLGALLKKYECTVLTAMDAKNGLTIADAKLPDLILLDVLMPEMDGFQTYDLLSKNNKTKDIPVIYLTALDNPTSKLKGFELGAVDYITKPYNHSELVARISTRLKQKMENTCLKAMFDSKSNSFITLNRNFEITNFNTTAKERSFLFNHESLQLGEDAFKYIDVADHKFLKRRIENALLGKVVEFEKSYTQNGETKWFNYTIEPIKNGLGEVTGCIVSGTDVTTKRESELEDVTYMQKIHTVFDETQQSLRYASYIQKAIFPHTSEISEQFKDSFVFFKPKEKVSGDFYWTYDLGEKSILILGDCTGHGVPGALLTTISIVLLERIVKYQQIHSPEKILAELNSNIVNILNQKDGIIKDGMEMAVCVFDRISGTIEFAGAKRSLLVASADGHVEYKGCRQEIGGVDIKQFTKQVICPTAGNAVYIFSDGFTDQIGGEKNKKFMKKKLKGLIDAYNYMPMAEQHLKFEDVMNKWIGYEEQTDDILLIGIRV